MLPPSELVDFCTSQYPRVLGTIRLLVHDERLAEDLSQETFVRVCRDWERVYRLENPGPWVNRVAVNLALSALRKRGSEGRANARLGASTSPEATTDLGYPYEQAAVLDALSVLDVRLRTVLVLRFFADLSVGEVGDLLGIPEGTVKSATRRALDVLRDAGLIEKVQLHD